MTDTVLDDGLTRDENGNSCEWIIDYDSTAKTIGVNIITTGTCTAAVLSVTLSSSGDVFALDCLNGQAGNITNKGRVVLGGPGSVLGQTNPINNLPVPPFLPKGTPPPYRIDFSWHQ